MVSELCEFNQRGEGEDDDEQCVFNTFTDHVISSYFNRKCVLMSSIHPSGIQPHTESENWIFKMYCIMLSTIAIPILCYVCTYYR